MFSYKIIKLKNIVLVSSMWWVLLTIFSFQVLKESFKIYCAINDGIINLVDKVC